MKKNLINLAGGYSEISRYFSALEGREVKRLLIMLPGAGCAYYRQSGGCSMCGFHLATDKYSHGFLYPSFVFKILFSLALAKAEKEQVTEVAIFNGGSFLNNQEIPAAFQEYVYRRVAASQSIKKLFIESRCEYIVETKVKKAKELLGNKNLTIGIGLESQDDRVRNILIKKGLSKVFFERKVALLKNYDFSCLAYVFLKPLGLEEKEAYGECLKTIRYALSVGVTEIALSCAFVQEGTKMAQAYHAGQFRPPYLWTVLEIIKLAVRKSWPLQIGSFSDEPLPIAVPSNCPECSEAIYQAIDNFRRQRKLGNVPKCSCHKNWQELMS